MQEAKRELRKSMRMLLKGMNEEDKKKESEAACSSFMDGFLYSRSDVILLYMAMNTEINPYEIMKKALKDNKTVAVPKIKSGTELMDFYVLDGRISLARQFSVGSFGIIEPDENVCRRFSFEEHPAGKITMILPGLAFTKDGKRLGHGKGFYDIYLSEVPKEADLILAGFCFDCQIVQDIPTESHDVLMDYVVTPTHFFESTERT